ncbi:zinc finger BED domain-containing protein RICESLEEPER [Trifolium repens]|nr:zinc finger BED domain-containing protein RICESLEEPER [Trifolium repens]
MSPPYGDFPSLISHQQIVEEEIESDDEVDQFDSQFLPICASAILQDDFPFDYFERETRRNFLQQLNPNVVLPPPNVIEAYVSDLYTEEKLKLKQELTTIPNRISLSFDLWESCTTETYICLTAHFVDADWKLKSKLLNFCVVLDTAAEMCERTIEFLNDWGIEKKIFSITLDQSPKNDIFQEELKMKLGLQNGLVCDGEFFHARCFALMFKQIVEEGLKVVSHAVCKIRESIWFVKESKSRRQKFRKCVEKVGGVDSSARLRSDMSMSVNSTYSMLESALKYRGVFESLHLYDDSYESCPSTEEWKRVERICPFLLPFCETANMINGTTQPTSNMYFLQVWKVQCVLVDTLEDEDEVIKRMAKRMMNKFKKYWDEYSDILALGVVLDPRMKFSRLAYCYSKLDPSTCEQKLQKLKTKLYMLFDSYSSKSTSSGVQTPIHDLFDELKMHHQELDTETGKSQLDIYLDEPGLGFHSYEDMDVLQWWKNNNDRFPELSRLACDLLSVPITTVASNSEYCTGSHFFNKYKDRMLPMEVETRICTRSWLYNFVSNDREDDDDDDDFEEMMKEFDGDDDGEDGDE